MVEMNHSGEIRLCLVVVVGLLSADDSFLLISEVKIARWLAVHRSLICERLNE